MASMWQQLVGPDYKMEQPDPAANLAYVGEQTGGVDSTSQDEEPERKPLSGKENLAAMRENLQRYIANQNQSQNALQKLANQYGKQLDADSGQLNLSPLMQLSDMWWGGNAAKSYKAPMTDEERTAAKLGAQEQVQKSGGAIASELLKEYGTDNSAQNSLYRSMANKNNYDLKTEKALDDMEQKFSKVMNPMHATYGGGSNNLGNRLARARSITALIRQHPDLNLDPRELKDTALSMATLLSNQNRVPYELVQDLVPKTFQGDFSKAVEYFFNHPKETNSQEFVKRMMATVEKEQETATEQIKAIQDQQAEGFYPLALKRPDRFAAHMNKAKNYLSMPSLDKMPKNPDAPANTFTKAQLEKYYNKYKASFPGGIKDAAKHLKGAGNAVEGY